MESDGIQRLCRLVSVDDLVSFGVVQLHDLVTSAHNKPRAVFAEFDARQFCAVWVIAVVHLPDQFPILSVVNSDFAVYADGDDGLAFWAPLGVGNKVFCARNDDLWGWRVAGV